MTTTSTPNKITYMVRKAATGPDYELLMHIEGWDAWTVVCDGPQEAIEVRFARLELARL